MDNPSNEVNSFSVRLRDVGHTSKATAKLRPTARRPSPYVWLFMKDNAQPSGLLGLYARLPVVL
jgi:hypothetical protein